jgi:5-methyltetrahydrofolate corrinoid/iron sulfur protein methyltransferase
MGSRVTGKSFKKSLTMQGGFPVIAEMAAGPNFGFKPIEDFCREAAVAGESALPKGYEFVAITSPQNPGGIATLQPVDVLGHLREAGLLGQLDFIPHITCKDQNADSLMGALIGYRYAGVESVLAFTGDKPLSAKGVFELDSLGLLNLIERTNNKLILEASVEGLGAVHQFFPGAAVNPFKYTEASLMQQFYKMEKKLACGARFFVTQVGWDWQKSMDLLRYIKDNNISAPIVGNVYMLTTQNSAARLMHDGKLPGCYVPDELYNRLVNESFEEHIARAAQQVAMYKSIGAAAVDIAGVSDFQTFVRIISLADQIGSDWELYKDNLSFPRAGGFNLYDAAGKRVSLSKPRKKFKQRFFSFMHDKFFERDTLGARCFAGALAVVGAQKGSGFVYTTFNTIERAFKYPVFDCQDCGDCFLPENFGVCTIGGCEKGLSNAPCGDATAEGHCIHNPARTCIGETIYAAAAAELNGRDRWKATINPPRGASLEHTSSIINYFFGRDHARLQPLIGIGEAVHASIAKTGLVMKRLHAMGPSAYVTASPELDYIRALITSQVDDGAAYVAVNVDAFGESDAQQAVDMMVEYVRLVRKWGKGVPVCIDSSNDDVLRAGLKEWYSTTDAVARPLVNSIKVYTMAEMMPLKKQYDFSFIGLLVTDAKPVTPGANFHSVDELFEIALKIYDNARKHGFKPGDIFFDPAVFPLAIDMPMQPGVPSYTYRTFELMKKIRNNSRLRGVHISLGLSNAVKDFPARKIGVLRAYARKAIDSGLDAGIVNTSHHYGSVEPDARLMKLIDAYAGMDGTAEKTSYAMDLMAKFCQENRKN